MNTSRVRPRDRTELMVTFMAVKSFVNLEEEPGKAVGHRAPPGDARATAMTLQYTLVELNRSLGRALVPRGVYRFTSHEEANTWMWEQLATCRKS